MAMLTHIRLYLLLILIDLKWQLLAEIRFAPIGQKWSLFDRHCDQNSDCVDIRHKQFVCADNRCVCESDYRLDVSDNQCKQFICRQHEDCRESDHNRVCDEGQCLCPHNLTVDSVSKICVQPPGYQYYWFWCLLFLFPSIIASIHGLVNKHRRLSKVVADYK